MSGSAPEPTGPRAGLGRGLALLLALTAGALLGALLIRQLGPAADDQRQVRGRALGEVARVLVAEPARSILVEADLERTDGGVRYAAGVSARAEEPWVSVEGPAGSRVESGALHLEGAVTEVPALALWSTPLRVRREGDDLRFDWSPLPGGEGFPHDHTYSLLIEHPNREGERSQVTLVAGREPWAELTLAELQQFLPTLAEGAEEATLEVRAYDPADKGGPLWVGRRVTWVLFTGEVRD